MRLCRVALITVSALVITVAAAGPVSAASRFQLCLRDQPANGNSYFLNFNVQGNAILVSGTKGVFGDDHGPLFGSLSKAFNTPPAGGWEMGLTVTIANMGDFAGHNTENIVFVFSPSGTIAFKRWKSSSQTFEQGTAVAFTCPE